MCVLWIGREAQWCTIQCSSATGSSIQRLGLSGIRCFDFLARCSRSSISIFALISNHLILRGNDKKAVILLKRKEKPITTQLKQNTHKMGKVDTHSYAKERKTQGQRSIADQHSPIAGHSSNGQHCYLCLMATSWFFDLMVSEAVPLVPLLFYKGGEQMCFNKW